MGEIITLSPAEDPDDDSHDSQYGNLCRPFDKKGLRSEISKQCHGYESIRSFDGFTALIEYLESASPKEVANTITRQEVLGIISRARQSCDFSSLEGWLARLEQIIRKHNGDNSID